MFIAQTLRKTNIIEYLLYMWSLEDILRAYECSITQLKEEFLTHFDVSEDDYADLVDWYADLIRMLNSEGKREKGHLTINLLVLQQVEELHAQLLASPKFPYYNAQYYKVLPYIVELRSRGNMNKSELETCIDTLYVTIVMRSQKKKFSPATEAALKEISTFLGMLADYYKADKERGIFLDDDQPS